MYKNKPCNNITTRIMICPTVRLPNIIYILMHKKRAWDYGRNNGRKAEIASLCHIPPTIVNSWDFLSLMFV